MAVRKRRSGSRTTSRKRASSTRSRRSYSARKPRRANKRVRRPGGRPTQTIRLEIVQPSPAITNPLRDAMMAREQSTQPKKARF